MTDRHQTLTLSQAAALLGRSKRFVGNLRERGYIATRTRGEYTPVNLIRGTIAYFEDQIAKNAKAAQKVAVTDARTREIELRIKDKAEQLIPLKDVEDILDEWMPAITKEMAIVPGRAFDDPVRCAEVEQEIKTSLDRIDKMICAAKERLAKGDV